MKTKTIILLTCFILLGIESFAQTSRFYETNPDRKRANIWYFGQYAGIDFNNSIQSKSDGKGYSWEGCASICDTSGRLLYYSDGKSIFDKNNDTVKNGNNLLGGFSSTQGVIILCHPLNDSIFYIVTSPNATQTNIGLNLSIINSKLNNGKGEVILKNKVILQNSCEKISAVYHKNNTDIWLIGHEWESNNFYSFLITKDGINYCTVISPAGSYLGYQFGSLNSTGQLKFSNNGNNLINPVVMKSSSEIFKFNNETGKITFNSTLVNKRPAYGVEFSIDSKLFYMTETGNDSSFIFQYSTSSPTNKTILSRKKFMDIQGLQIASNGEIIIAENDSTTISRITFPNIKGVNCTLQKMSISLSPKKSAYGLPNFNQSYFYTPSIDFAYHYDCINNSIDFVGRDTFFADTHKWTIGEINHSTEGTYSKKNITHIFKDTGTYQIQYVASKGNRSDTVIKKLMIYPKIRKDFLGRDTAYETGTSFSKTLKAPLGMHCYYWQKDSSTSASFQADTTGIFICRITSQSFCVVTDTIVISSCINDLAVPILTRTLDSLYASHSLADSFIWYRNGLQYRITNVPNLALSDTGKYRVEAAKKGHCNRSSNSQYVNKFGTNYPGIIPDAIKVYPNPTKEVLNIEFDRVDKYEIIVYDLVGQIVLRLHTDTNLDLNLKEFSEGIYLLHITNTKNEQANFKIIKV